MQAMPCWKVVPSRLNDGTLDMWHWLVQHGRLLEMLELSSWFLMPNDFFIACHLRLGLLFFGSIHQLH